MGLSCEVWIGWGDSTIANISWATSINNGTQSKLNSSDTLVEVTQAKSQSGLSVISSLKIAQLREEDGGEYFCLNEDDPTKKSAEVLPSKKSETTHHLFVGEPDSSPGRSLWGVVSLE